MTALQKAPSAGFSQNMCNTIQKTSWSTIKLYLKLWFDAPYLLQGKEHSQLLVSNSPNNPSIYSVQNKRSGKSPRALFWVGLHCTTIYDVHFLFLCLEPARKVPMTGKVWLEALWSLSECVCMKSAETLPETSPKPASCVFLQIPAA